MAGAAFKMNPFFVVLLMIKWRVFDSAVINWCEKTMNTDGLSSDEKALFKDIHHSRPDQSPNPLYCYFYVNCANDMSHEHLPGDEFRFNLQVAESICWKYNGATLPTISDDDEMRLVLHGIPGFAGKGPVVLGLKKVPGKAEIHRWNDGLASTYHPPQWNGADQHEDLTYANDINGQIQWTSESLVSGNFYTVYCKQNLTTKSPRVFFFSDQ